MESVGQKKRNYRRRPCPHSLGGDGDDDDYDEAERNDLKDVKSSANDDGNQRLKQRQPLSSGEGGLCFPFPSFAGGKGSSSAAVACSSTQRGDDGGDGQNGARIASGIGFRMLRSMGWTENTGLGQSGKGMVDPILPIARPGNLGVGFSAATVFDTQQEAIRQVQRAKREERDRKLKLKLEKDQEAEEEDVFMRESFLAVSTNSTDGQQPLESSSTLVEGAADIHNPQKSTGLKPAETGQCPHCRQRFETKKGLKSHVQARHAKLLQATKRSFKKERKRNGKRSDKGGTVRALVPMKQNFSTYD